ncbi:unnamed protein product, partial [Ectocarpus sp. 12 AP-2014]
MPWGVCRPLPRAMLLLATLLSSPNPPFFPAPNAGKKSSRDRTDVRASPRIALAVNTFSDAGQRFWHRSFIAGVHQPNKNDTTLWPVRVPTTHDRRPGSSPHG